VASIVSQRAGPAGRLGDLVPYRGLDQIPHEGEIIGAVVGGGVMVFILAGVQDGGDGFEGGLGDLGLHGGLLSWLVPQHLEVEGPEQLGLQPRGQAQQDVPGQRELVEQGGVGGRLMRGTGGP